MRRKYVSQRSASIDEVRAALHAHRGGVGDKLEAQRAVPGAEGFTYQGFFDHADDELQAVHRAMIASEDVHVRNLVLGAQLRRQSQELAERLYEKQTAARQILTGIFGRELDFELAAIAGPTPRQPMVLAQQVDQTVKMLRKPVGELPPPRLAVGVDLAALASELETEKRAFLRVRGRYDRVRKAVDGTRVALHEQLDRVDRVFLWIARALEGLFKLAGEPELAARIRTSTRRIVNKQAEEETGSEPDASAEEDEPAADVEAPAEPSESAEPAEPASQVVVAA